MNQPLFSDIHLPDLGIGAGLVVLGFRACAFGRQDCRCVGAMYEGALSSESQSVLGHVLIVTRALASEGRRKIQLSAPGCGRITRDEISIVCAFSAAQAQDMGAMITHLENLLGTAPRRGLIETVCCVSDALAGNGHAINAPDGARRVPGAETPAFARGRS